MKLRNKKTGEIGELSEGGGYITVWLSEKAHGCSCENKNYTSLAELNAEWEDYEDPEDYWFLNSLGEAIQPSDTTDWRPEDIIYHKTIGNYFETREEDEKAVEKLKALNRLNEHGLVWIWRGADYDRSVPGFKLHLTAGFRMDNFDGALDDLKLLFGGKE